MEGTSVNTNVLTEPSPINKERNEKQMSYVGLMKSKNGIVAFGDSRSSENKNGTLYIVDDNTKKVFQHSKFIFVAFDSNIYVEDKKQYPLSRLLDELIRDYPNVDCHLFFQKVKDILNNETFSYYNNVYRFIIGTKEMDKMGREEYVIYSLFITKDGVHYENLIKDISFLTSASKLRPYDYGTPTNESIEVMEYKAKHLVEHVISLGNSLLDYNPVGGEVQIESFQ